MATRMLRASCSKSAFKMPENREKNMPHFTNNCCHMLMESVRRCIVQLDRHPRRRPTAALAWLLLVSDLSDGCSDHLPLLVLAGCTELHRETEKLVTRGRLRRVNTFHAFFPLNTILVSSSMSWTDCNFFERTSNFSADSDLR